MESGGLIMPSKIEKKGRASDKKSHVLLPGLML
jgi:hypothetical protein